MKSHSHRLEPGGRAPTPGGRSQALTIVTGKPGSRTRARRYSYDTLRILQRVWAASGGQHSKYFKESMPLPPSLLETSDELETGPGFFEACHHRPLRVAPQRRGNPGP